MKQINRKQLRKESLYDFCKNAKICQEINKDNIKECYCYGVIQLINDEPIEQCRECKAYYKNINW